MANKTMAFLRVGRDVINNYPRTTGVHQDGPQHPGCLVSFLTCSRTTATPHKVKNAWIELHPLSHDRSNCTHDFRRS